MNHCYRLLFNYRLQLWQAVPEFAIAGRQAGAQSARAIMFAVSKVESRLGLLNTSLLSMGLPKLKTLFACIALGQGLATSGMIYALPTGADIQYGQATLQTANNQLTIYQSSSQLIANWQSFGVAAHEAVQLLQPVQGLALFRVVGTEASQIYGQLTATGSLFLINPNGVLFGQGAQVDVGGLVATTMQMSNTDFLNGRYQFHTDGSSGAVTNQGVIKAADGGYIVLLANSVNNSGSLLANQGSVVLAGTQSAELDFYGNGLVKARLSGDALNALVAHSGRIEADGGTVQLATSARSAAVNVTGLVQANSLVARNGVIRLEGGEHAKVSVSGQLRAAGVIPGSKGGRIEVTGEQVALLNGATLDASGDMGGGTVLVGGDYQGNNTAVYNARTTYVDAGATVKVDANTHGDGGKAVIWADGITRYYGQISAKGGAHRGHGGLVEVSGKQVLDFIGGVDVSAVNGLGGWVLLDPQDIVLNTTTQAAPPNNANGTPDVAFAAAPVAGTTTIQIADITGYSELFLQATNNITINNPLTMAVNNSIRLEANNNIAVNGAVTVSGTGSIQLKADADNSGSGNLAIGANITSQAGGITLTGATISRTAGNITATGGANANAGNISIVGTGLVNLGAATISANGGTAAASSSGRNGGVIAISGAGVTATGAMNANGSAAATAGSNQNGGNAGSITMTSTNGITAGAMTASGGAATTTNGNGGNAGSITLTNNTAGNISAGALTSRTGAATGTGIGGVGGSIAVTNHAVGASINTAALNTAGNAGGNGGGVTLTGQGDVTVTGTVNSSGTALAAGTRAGSHAGNITITGVNRAITGAITASGSAANGANQVGGNAANVAITGTGTLSTAAMTVRTGAATGTGTGGVAGGITLNGTNVASGTLTTTGGTNGHGGAIAVTSTSGTLSVGAIATSGGAALAGTAGRNAGSISLNASGALTAASVTANGTNGTVAGSQSGGNGGVIQLASTASTLTTGAISAIGGNGVGTNANGGQGGHVTLNAGGVTPSITMANITTTGGNRVGTGTAGAGGSITLADDALLSANTTMTSTGGSAGVGAGGSIQFAGTLNSAGANRSLTVNSNGTTTFSGAVGNALALASLTTNATGTTALNGGAVTTTGAQTYNDNVTLGAATVLSTTNSNVTFTTASSILNAAGNPLTISAGTGAVSAANASNNFASLAMNAASANIRDSNAIVLGASNITGNYTLQTAGAVTQTAGVTVGGTTTINAGATNDITLNNPNNQWNAVTIASGRDVNLVDADALTLNASSVRTIAAHTLSNNLTLAGAITASGTGAGTSITLAAAQNFVNSGNFALNSGAGSRWLVYSTNPTADTRGAGLLTASNFKQYGASLGDTILGTGNGFIYSDTPLITASLGGSTTKVYDGTTIAPITGLTLAQSGAIDGDVVNVAALTGASYADKHVADNKTVTSDALTITGASNGAKPVYGYALSSPTVSANVGQITPRAITVTANSGQTKVFGSADPLPFTYSVGGMGLVGGDILLGALDRIAGEAVGDYAIIQGSLDAGSNYTLTYEGNTFAILTPSVPSGNGSPRDTAGLGGLITANDRAIQSLLVLNLSATSAGDAVASDDATEGCTSNTEKFNHPNTSILFNYGMKLPKGVKQDCI